MISINHLGRRGEAGELCQTYGASFIRRIEYSKEQSVSKQCSEDYDHWIKEAYCSSVNDGSTLRVIVRVMGVRVTGVRVWVGKSKRVRVKIRINGTKTRIAPL